MRISIGGANIARWYRQLFSVLEVLGCGNESDFRYMADNTSIDSLGTIGAVLFGGGHTRYSIDGGKW